MLYYSLQVCNKLLAEIMRDCKNHTNHNDAGANIISIEIFAPSQFVPVRVKTREYHN